MMQTNSPYKTAAELGIEQWEHDGLAALVGPLSRGELRFHITPTVSDCGTAACIGGWVALRAGRPFSSVTAYVMSAQTRKLQMLYYPYRYMDRSRPNTLQAARATVNFLTLGDPRWDDVMHGPALTASNSERAANEEAVAGALAAIERVLAGDLDDFDADDSGAMSHVLEEVA